jgi:hypothetical protein
MNASPISQIEETLRNMDSSNPLVRGVCATWQVYLSELTSYIKQNPQRTGAVILPTPRSEVEAFALELFELHLRSYDINVTVRREEQT